MFVVLMPKQDGIYLGTEMNDYMRQHEVATYFHYVAGDAITDFRYNRIGVSHLKLPSYESMRMIAENPHNYFDIKVKEG